MNREEKLKVRKFLMGLNEKFKQVRSNILAMDTLPKLGKTFQMIAHEGAQHGQKQNVAAHAFYSARTPSIRTSSRGSGSSHAGKVPMTPMISQPSRNWST